MTVEVIITSHDAYVQLQMLRIPLVDISSPHKPFAPLCSGLCAAIPRACKIVSNSHKKVILFRTSTSFRTAEGDKKEILYMQIAPLGNRALRSRTPRWYSSTQGTVYNTSPQKFKISKTHSIISYEERFKRLGSSHTHRCLSVV